MTTIPKKLREQLAQEPFYHKCARNAALHDHECQRDPLNPFKPVDWEHALYSKGKKLNTRFAIIPLCWWAHRGPGMVKDINVWIALNRASDEELFELSKQGGCNYFQKRHYLNTKYGEYDVHEPMAERLEINYDRLPSYAI